jgi:lauroyl/myristoyl acyltransferase
MLSALVMLFAFLPPLFRDRLRKRREQIAANPALAANVENAGEFPGAKTIDAPPDPLSPFRKTATFALTAMLILVPSAVLMFSGLPKIDSTSDALRPRNSPAYAALDEMKVRLSGNREPIWLIAQGRDESAIIREFESALPLLNQAVSNQVLSEFTLPLILWPHPEHQTANRIPAAAIVAERQNLHAAALDQGFTPDSLRVADTILNTWQAALNHPAVFWPTNELSRWVLEKVAARDTNGFIGVGFLFPSHPTHGNAAAISELADTLRDRGLTLSGWQLLGSSILKRVQQNLWKVLFPMIALVLISLWLAFRHPIEIGLSLAVLALSGLALAAVMQLFGWSWNLMNLMALPLMLGSGVDYSIFMQLALRRHGGNLADAHHAVGRALLLCGGTAVAGFGSLSLSTNAGMASLGEVCATGIGLNMLIAVFLLPTWWRTLRRGSLLAENSIRNESGDRMTPASETSAPSSLYRAELWRVGLWTARVLPRGLCLTLGRILAAAYWHLRRERREIVIENLLPLLDGDRMAAQTKARQLFRQFGVKLIDLWRYEAGLPINHLMGQTSGWEHFAHAQAEKRGVLVITPHLGNWEFGGPALTERGIKLQVVTLAEPGRDFTELRQASRAQWQIETLVIGNDPFAVLEIIKRLESGAVVALLIDRPPPTSAIEVEFCGRPFSASVAAAELARATGCVVLPVYLPREGDTYAARVLPAVDYERAALRDPAERRRLTQQIMRAFEPVIRQHSDQWYHFVPIWPRQK